MDKNICKISRGCLSVSAVKIMGDGIGQKKNYSGVSSEIFIISLMEFHYPTQTNSSYSRRMAHLYYSSLNPGCVSKETN
jgi:hypothetical protein